MLGATCSLQLCMNHRRSFLSALSCTIAALGAANHATAQESQAQPTPREAARLPLPEPFTGWEARFVEVRYPAGSASPQHRHPGFVLGYVVEGEFRFAINGESPRNLS